MNIDLCYQLKYDFLKTFKNHCETKLWRKHMISIKNDQTRYFNILQIKEINVKYADIEKNLITQRKQAKQEVASFLDDKVGINLSKLSRQLGRLEAKLSTNHQVCLYVYLMR